MWLKETEISQIVTRVKHLTLLKTAKDLKESIDC